MSDSGGRVAGVGVELPQDVPSGTSRPDTRHPTPFPTPIAAADERAGLSQAVMSVETWACDVERFPLEPWVAAVRETIERARAVAR